MSTVHLFSQVASLIDRTIVVSAAKKRHTDKYCQTLDTWTHLIALLFCHMADCQSLRDICKGLQGIRGGLNHLGIQKAPSRNALSHQNAKRDAMVFRDIYQFLHKRLGQQAFTCRFREGIKASRIMLLDSSVITLCLSMFNWAHYSEEKGAIKLHTLFSLNDFLPIDVHVSDGKMSDNIGAYHLMPPGRSIIVADRGYDDTELWRDWDSRGISFVVRLRKDIKFTRKEAFSQPDDREQDILVDEAIELIGDDTSKNYPHPLRRVVVYRPYDSSRRKSGQTAEATDIPEHTIELITNNAYWEADTISALYKARWQIESFFKTIKQHLRIKTFIGTNKNAVMCQIWTAMIAILLLQYLRSKAKYDWHMSNLVTFIRIHLMSYIDLWVWINQQEDRVHSPPKLTEICIQGGFEKAPFRKA